MERGFRGAFKHSVAAQRIHPLEVCAKQLRTGNETQLEAESEADQSTRFFSWVKQNYILTEQHAFF